MNKAMLIPGALMALTGCGKDHSGAALNSYLPPAGFIANAEHGAPLFQQFCARCHGEAATGSNAGPPLVHKVYEPDHHPDLAFFRAAKFGIPAHHWQFGDMPPVPDVTPEQVAHIAAYVRGLQKKAGIF